MKGVTREEGDLKCFEPRMTSEYFICRPATLLTAEVSDSEIRRKGVGGGRGRVLKQEEARAEGGRNSEKLPTAGRDRLSFPLAPKKEE